MFKNLTNADIKDSNANISQQKNMENLVFKFYAKNKKKKVSTS